MPVRVRYVLEIGGRLAGRKGANGPILRRVITVLPPKGPGGAGRGWRDRWPRGFVHPEGRVRFWTCEAETGGAKKPETRILFLAEVDCHQHDTIHKCRGPLKHNFFHWYTHHRRAQWHKDLKRQLEKLNGDIVRAHGHAKLIEKIWFREWQFYCGNGGDS